MKLFITRTFIIISIVFPALASFGSNPPKATAFPLIEMLGTSVAPFDWSAGVEMTTTDGINYTLVGYTLIGGEVKFRQDTSWTTNWGNVFFPDGHGYPGGPNIPVIAGKYTITFNRLNGEYFFFDLGNNNRKFVNDNSTANDIFTTAAGSDLNNGSSGSPYRSIQYAIQQLNTGDTLFVDAGTYAEQVTIDKGLTIFGAGLSSIITVPASAMTSVPGINPKGVLQTTLFTSNVNFVNLHIISSLSNGHYGIITQCPGYVKNCIIENAYCGIFAENNNWPLTVGLYQNYISNVLAGIACHGGELTAYAYNNEITLANVNPSIGFYVGYDFGLPIKQFAAGQNSINNYRTYGFAVNSRNSIISNNSIRGLAGYAIQTTDTLMQATCNAFGTNIPDSIDAKINGFVNVSPWLTVWDDVSEEIGFQQVPNRCDGVYTGPHLTSVNPSTATALTRVTITGNKLAGINPTYGISFGDVVADSAFILSDTAIVAWVGRGATGKVKVYTNNFSQSDSLTGFSYVPLPAVNSTRWEYLGNPGFSGSRAYHVNTVTDKNDVPYAIFKDSASGRAVAMRYTDTAWVQVGSDISDGNCMYTKIATDTANKPVAAYTDVSNGNRLMVKRYDGNSWVDLGLPSTVISPFAGPGMVIDKSNHIYVTNTNNGRVNIFRYNGSNWQSFLDVAKWAYAAQVTAITLGKDDVPYIIYGDSAYDNQASVKKLSGASWIAAGTQGFTNSASGVFYPVIKTDTSGNPIAAFQEDNGFERMSSYKLQGASWNPIGTRFFSRGRCYFSSLVIDKKNQPFLAFRDDSYNRQGTVMTFDSATGEWQRVGERGVIPCADFDNSALYNDKGNRMLVAFPDVSKNGKASVMQMITDNTWVGGVSSAWENALNWSSGTLPSRTSNVIIPAGAVIQLNSTVLINSISISPSASLSISPGGKLTVTGY